MIKTYSYSGNRPFKIKKNSLVAKKSLGNFSKKGMVDKYVMGKYIKT